VAIVEDEPEEVTCASNFIRVLRVDQEIVEARFLFHYMRTSEFQEAIKPHVRGTTMKNLAVTQAFSTANVPLPTLREQRGVVEVFDQLDAMERSQVRASQSLGELPRAVFNEMLVNLGEVPTSTFGELCERLTVGVVVKPASYYVPVGVPALRTLNVKPGFLDLDELVFFSEESSNGPLAKSRLRAGDLVIARTGRPGTTSIVPSDLEGANAIDLIVATPRYAVATSEYLEGLMNSSFMTDLVAGEKRGQVQQHFNLGSLKAARVPVPPLDTQRTFAERVKCVNQARHCLSVAIRERHALESALRANLFGRAA